MIASDALKEIFEPFFTGKAEGMEWDLSIARPIIEAQQGLISAKNRDQGGASATPNDMLSQSDSLRLIDSRGDLL